MSIIGSSQNPTLIVKAPTLHPLYIIALIVALIGNPILISKAPTLLP